MRLANHLICVTLVAALLAGCSAKTSSTVVDATSLPPLSAGKGAITGLVIDDRYRPVPDAMVLLTPLGLTATTDAEGQFQFADLEPGSFVALVQVKDHEAAPKNVDVTAGQYADLELMARRIFSDSGSVITQEYSVFIPCAFDYVVNGLIYGCVPDSSGDTYRPGISVDFRAQKTNLTYLVSEILLNQPDSYVFVVRCSDGSSFGCGEYGYVNTTGGNYGKVIMQNPGNYMHTPHSLNWTNKVILDGLLFYYGTGGPEVTTVARPAGCLLPPTTNPLNNKPAFCRDFYGAGAKFGVKAKIVMTAFLGQLDPGLDIEKYSVLGPK